jgi:hypothetical protein
MAVPFGGKNVEQDIARNKCYIRIPLILDDRFRLEWMDKQTHSDINHND